MSKRKQEVVNSDLTSKKSLTFPLAVAGRANPKIAEEIRVSRHTNLCRQNREAHFIDEPKKAKASSRRARLTALSKVVNKAFTGWTVKTQG